MSNDPKFTQEEAIVIAELQQILQNINKAIDKLPVHLKKHLLSSIKILDQETQSFNSALDQ